jgi:hypothetical protein
MAGSKREGSLTRSQAWSNGSKSHIFATTVFPHKFTTMTPHTEPGYLCRVASLPSLSAAGAPKKPANAMPHKPEWFEENLAKMVEDGEKQTGGSGGSLEPPGPLS